MSIQSTPSPGSTSNPPPRRVITGHDSDNTAKVILDSPAIKRVGSTGIIQYPIWCTDDTPAEIQAGLEIEDMALRPTGTPPPENGSRIGVIDFLPGNKRNWHRTETIDYAIVLSGEIDMELEEGSIVHLRAGDIVVQRGTYHAWLNRGTEPARIAVVLIDAKPLGIGHPITRGAVASPLTELKR